MNHFESKCLKTKETKQADTPPHHAQKSKAKYIIIM